METFYETWISIPLRKLWTGLSNLLPLSQPQDSNIYIWGQYFSILNVWTSHMGISLKCQFCFSRLGVGLKILHRFCIFFGLPGCAQAACWSDFWESKVSDGPGASQSRRGHWERSKAKDPQESQKWNYVGDKQRYTLQNGEADRCFQAWFYIPNSFPGSASCPRLVPFCWLTNPSLGWDPESGISCWPPAYSAL